jgi:transposase InsO family protein
MEGTLVEIMKVVEERTKKDPVGGLRSKVPKAFWEFLDVFDKGRSERLPERKTWDHAIDLKPGFVPKRAKVYPINLQEEEELKEWLKEQLAKGYIRPSKSPNTAPIFFIPKADGSRRLIIDSRYLNSVTEKNAYPLPLISEIIEKLKGARIFTKMDLRWGYYNVRIREGDEWKAAFATRYGAFEPLVMTFGLTNAPATFQNMMNDIFGDLIMRDVLVVYLDDILVFTETVEENEMVVREVLRRLQGNDLFVKPEKCEFFRASVDFLGVNVAHNEVRMQDGKVAGVRDWPPPTKVKELQAFLGFANYYRRFIPKYSEVARPLFDLLKKDVKFVWGTEQQDAFGRLKGLFTSEQVLCMPDPRLPLRLETDASLFAVAAVLSNETDSGWRPCGFISRSLSPAERNYDTHDRELLAIVYALEEWRHICEGAAQKVIIYSDHANLRYFMTAKKLNRRQARWSLFLSRFDFEIVHKPGKENARADVLSRRPDHKEGIEDDNSDVVLLPKELFKDVSERIYAVNPSLKEKIKAVTNFDESVTWAVDQLLKGTKPTLVPKEWGMEDGMVTHAGKVYVPKDEGLRREVVALHHDSPMCGHPGLWKTLELIQRNYWWPGITKFVRRYLAGCDHCQRYKNFPQSPVGPLNPLPVPERPWQEISVDLITDLPLSRGYDSILVVVDRFSKQAHFVPCTKTLSSHGLAVLYRDYVWKLHGLPDSITSDRGPQFASDFMRELCSMLSIRQRLSTAFHPQTDGQTERVNQAVEQYLRLYINWDQYDWSDRLPQAEFAYNNLENSSSHQSPFLVANGFHPRIGVEVRDDLRIPMASTFAGHLQKVWEEAKHALLLSQQEMKRFYDRSRGALPNYKIGDKVWLEVTNLRLQRSSRKLSERRLGPFTIEKIVSPFAIQLKLPGTLRIHPVVNVTRLRPYVPPIPGQQVQPPPPIELDGEPEWEVSQILDARLRRGRLQFLVRWKGFTPDHDSWEPEENVAHAPKLVEEFYRDHPDAPKKIEQRRRQ